MPVTSQPTDQPYGQVLTDQAALERIFRDHYTRLVADARNRLGDAAAAAPRVVSKAFHLAWQDRKRFHSMEELDAFLGAQIHHGAAREQSRIAGLHRMDSHGAAHKEAKHETAEMTVDEAWERLEHTLQGGAPDAYRARASTARHEAAAHVKGLAAKRSWGVMIGVGVAALILAIAVIWYIDKAGESRAIDRALVANNVRAYETGAAQQMNVTLDDSTVVRLGAESKLTIPARFGMSGGYRAVKVEGVAYFTVTQAGDKPLEVRNGPVAVVAHGTKFTVRKYREDPSFIVHVAEGSVELRSGDQVRMVPAGTAYSVTNAGEMRVPGSDEVTEATAWVGGSVSIGGRNLRYALGQLKRWYNLDVHVEDVQLLARPVFLSAPIGSQREAITSIEKSGGLKFTYVGENMAFTDTVPSKKKR